MFNLHPPYPHKHTVDMEYNGRPPRDKLFDSLLPTYIECDGGLPRDKLFDPLPPTHIVDMECDGGSSGQSAQLQIHVCVCAREDDEVGNSQWACHLNKIHQYISLSHL